MDLKTNIITLVTSNFSNELSVVLLAATPILELRGAVPYGILKLDLSALKVVVLSLMGNMIPVFPLLIFFKHFFVKVQKLPWVGKLFSWWFRRVEAKAKIVERWGFWGLVVFVAIPLPVTGAWTGAVAATLCELKTAKAWGAIFIGVSIAAGIMCLVSVLAADVVRTWFSYL